MEEMVFGYMGVCYQETPLAVRELVSFTDSKKTELWSELEKIGVKQCVVLSTCNRSEIFFFFRSQKISMQQIRQCYETAFPGVPIHKYVREMQGEDAMAYLFRVAAGLESLVLGEDQILGQVVEAMDFARTMGHSGKELERVVREAVTCAKQIKTEYRISEKPLSVSYVGIQLLKQYGGIEGKRVLVIGSGKTASLALTYLVEYGASAIVLCSRNTVHARELQLGHPQLEVIDYKDRYQAMAHCDIVVSATSSPHLVVKREQWRRPDTGKTIFLDLAIPRDVDASLAEEEGVRVIDMDTLQQITGKNQKERERMAMLSQSRIRQKTEETMEWLRQSRMDVTIENLQKRCQEIEEDSFRYLNRKLNPGHREQKILKKVLHASLQRLLREPIRELKQLEDDETQREYRKVVEHLFRMEEGEK